MIIEIINKFHLQLFAEAGTLVNATGNYVNAYFNANASTGEQLLLLYTVSEEMKTCVKTK